MDWMNDISALGFYMHGVLCDYSDLTTQVIRDYIPDQGLSESQLLK